MINPLNSYSLVFLAVRYSTLYSLHSHLIYISCFNLARIPLCPPDTRKSAPILSTLTTTDHFTGSSEMLSKIH